MVRYCEIHVKIIFGGEWGGIPGNFQAMDGFNMIGGFFLSGLDTVLG